MIHAVSTIFTKKLIIALVITALLMMSVYDGVSMFIWHRSNAIIKKDDHNILLSQILINDLVEKMAKQQYLMDVSDKKLPWGLSNNHNYNHGALSHSKISKQTPKSVVQEKQQINITSRNKTVSNQQCLYQNKAYSIGEIIQTDQGWMCCVPILMLNQNDASQYRNVGWTLQGKLL